MIVLVGGCGLERLGDAVRRAGERVEVFPPTTAAEIAAREPTLVYLDLFDADWLDACWQALLGGGRGPSTRPQEATLRAFADLPLVVRGLRVPPGGADGPALLRPGPSLQRARRLLSHTRTVDVQGLWHRHGILDDGVRFGVGHGEPELGELGHSRLDGRSAADVEAEAVLAWLDARRGRTCKVVVVDLDDTLVYGEIAATDFAERNPAWGGNLPAAEAWWRAPRGIHEALRLARRRGLALALVSRNDEALVRARFRCLPPLRGRLLDVDSFDTLVVGFGAKSAACREVAARLGVGLDSLAFLDDSEVERAEVAANAPEVHLLPSDPVRAREVLTGGRRFIAWSATEAHARRPDSYRSRAAVTAASHEGEAALLRFLHALDIELGVREALLEDAPRIDELLARSHQLRLTGAASPPAGARVLLASCRDRLADHGIVGVLWFEGAAGDRRLGEFAMSCRVLPHRVAPSFLAAAFASEPSARATYTPTGRNAAAARLITEAREGVAGWVQLHTGIAPRA